MTKLIYAANVSVDGYIEDPAGGIDFFPTGDAVFADHTALMRSVGTLLYGRRLYEAMAVWETDNRLAEHSAAFAEFATAWQDTDKIVYSTTLAEASTARTRIVRGFDDAAVRDVKATASADATGDLLIGGADLATQALTAGLIDEVQLYVLPVVLGGGKPGFANGSRSGLELLDQHRFENGIVRLRYRPVSA